MSPDPPRPGPESVLFPDPAVRRRRWTAVAAGMVVLQFGYWPVVDTVLRAADGDASSPRLLTLGLGVMPLVFITLAFGSRHHRAPRAVLHAMGLYIVVGLPIMLVHVVAGLVAGYGAGGIAALRRDRTTESVGARVFAVALASLYAFILTAILPMLGLLFGALVALPTVAIADAVARRRRADREDSRPDNLRSP